MFELPDSILIRELKSLNSSGKKMNEQKMNKHEIYSQFCLNGDLSLREKNSCIVQLRDQFKQQICDYNLFSEQSNGRVKRVEVWTFEKTFLD